MLKQSQDENGISRCVGPEDSSMNLRNAGSALKSAIESQKEKPWEVKVD